MSDLSPRAFLYLRLSRDEVETPGALEDKFARQRATALDLAARHGLRIDPANILIEQESGSKLRNRPQLLRLMELMHIGLCSHVVTAFQDRIDRLEDKREQADLEDALYAGSVTIISRDGVTRYDDDLDPLPAEVRSLIARHELRLYSRRMREANRQRLARNEHVGGRPAYGYRLDKEAPGGYRVEPGEYSVVCEILRRVLAGESIRRLVADLNARGVPAVRSAKWSHQAVYNLVQNPLFAGYHARQTKRVRGRGYKHLSADDFELSTGSEGEWEHPITLAEWEQIRARFAAYRRPAYPRSSLLTGILHCPEGQPMAAAGVNSYGCLCESERRITRRGKWDELTRLLICEAVRRVPTKLLDRPLKDEAPRPRSHLAAARRELAKREDDVRGMVTDAERQTRLLGAELYETVLLKARSEWEQARRVVEDLQAQVAAPDLTGAVTLLGALRGHPMEDIWEAATVAERRQIVSLFVRRITLVANVKRLAHFKRAMVEWQDWAVKAKIAFEPPEDWWDRLRRGQL